jgi:hypothetical protein
MYRVFWIEKAIMLELIARHIFFSSCGEQGRQLLFASGSHVSCDDRRTVESLTDTRAVRIDAILV